MKLFFVFFILFSFESFSNSCKKVFETPSLSDEKYSLTALKEATDGLSYKDIISNYPSLSLKDEQALFAIDYNERAFQTLFLSNIYIIPYLSKRWRVIIAREGLYLSQPAVIALLSALRNYDYKKETRFVTYLSKRHNMVWPKKVIIYIDGASQGNPGPSALGLVVLNSDRNLIYPDASYLEDHKTNNFAEYQAIIRALELAVEKGVQELVLRSDSEFVIKQLRGESKVKSSDITDLFQAVQSLSKKIPRINFQYIPREENEQADALANQVLNREF